MKTDLNHLMLDSITKTVALEDLEEPLSNNEFSILELFLSYPEKPVYRHSVVDTLAPDNPNLPDRVVDAAMVRLIRKLSALHPSFPLLRRLGRDEWILTGIPPRKKSSAS